MVESFEDICYQHLYADAVFDVVTQMCQMQKVDCPEGIGSGFFEQG